MTNHLNTVLLAYSSPTLHHGSPRVLADIILGLDRKKFRPILVCPARGELTDFLEQRGVEVVIAPWRSITKGNFLKFLASILFFWKLIRNKNVRLFHMNQVGWRDSLVVAAWLRRIPIVLHLHMNLKYDVPLTRNWNFIFASSILVVADVLKKPFLEATEISKKLVTVHNGLSVDVFEKGRSIRPALGLGENDKVVGFIGQMVEAKGLRFLVSAAKPVLAAHPDAVFIFVGRRVAGEEGFVDELKGMAEQEGIGHALRFFGPRDDIPDVMKSLDIMVLPTLGEAFPKVILEAMGAGVPVIASAVGGIPEIIDHNVNGVLLPAGDAAALGDALVDLLNQPEKRQRLAFEGLRTVREGFSVQTQIAKITTVYDTLLGEG